MSSYPASRSSAQLTAAREPVRQYTTNVSAPGSPWSRRTASASMSAYRDERDPGGLERGRSVLQLDQLLLAVGSPVGRAIEHHRDQALAQPLVERARLTVLVDECERERTLVHRESRAPAGHRRGAGSGPSSSAACRRAPHRRDSYARPMGDARASRRGDATRLVGRDDAKSGLPRSVCHSWSVGTDTTRSVDRQPCRERC